MWPPCRAFHRDRFSTQAFYFSDLCLECVFHCGLSVWEKMGKGNGNIFPKPSNFQLCTVTLCNTGGMNSCCNVQEIFQRALIMSPHFDKVLKRNVCVSFFLSFPLSPPLLSSLLLSRRSSAETLKRSECWYTNLKTSMPWWGHTVTLTQGFTGSCKRQAFVALKSETIINNFNILRKREKRKIVESWNNLVAGAFN